LRFICKSSDSNAFLVANELIKKGMNLNEGCPLHVAIKNRYFSSFHPPPSLPLHASLLHRCVNMIWLLVLSGAKTNENDEETGKNSWQLCENESTRKALSRSWSTKDFKWFPAELQTSIVRYFFLYEFIFNNIISLCFIIIIKNAIFSIFGYWVFFLWPCCVCKPSVTSMSVK
jgi:hypothetical protein